jgi:proteasome lid subunit RPN8/RPN11
MIRWQEVQAPPAPQVDRYLAALELTDPAGAEQLRTALASRPAAAPEHLTPLVAVHAPAFDLALRSVIGNPLEQGGLLLGTAWAGASGLISLVQVRAAVHSTVAQASPVSLSMPTEVWNAARAQLQLGETVVGWYHSHPNIGAFFSSTDRRTQAAFFNHPHSLGWVIDPVRREQAWFAGAQSVELLSDQVVLVEQRRTAVVPTASPSGA